nr:alpha/beta hydrolases superfamily protein [Tanacetum cinerariifolium]
MKDLTSLSLDELIRNLKVYEMNIKKDSEIVKAKGERKSLALKSKNESSDEECSTSGSKDEEYAMAVRDFNRRECRKPPKDKNQRTFVEGSWSDSGEKDDEKAKDETCLVDQASNEICPGVDLEPDEWIKDSGCSKHITGNRKLFSSYKAYNEGNVIFGSNLRGNIIGKEGTSFRVVVRRTKKFRDCMGKVIALCDRGFLEKFDGGFEQDIDDEGEEDKEDKEGEEDKEDEEGDVKCDSSVI